MLDRLCRTQVLCAGIISMDAGLMQQSSFPRQMQASFGQ